MRPPQSNTFLKGTPGEMGHHSTPYPALPGKLSSLLNSGKRESTHGLSVMPAKAWEDTGHHPRARERGPDTGSSSAVSWTGDWVALLDCLGTSWYH